MAILQQEPLDAGAGGGQLIYPRLDGDWQPMAEWAAALDAVGEDGGEVFPSVDLGAYVVLAGTRRGSIAWWGAWRRWSWASGSSRSASRSTGRTTRRSGAVAASAAERLTDLPWRAPQLTLIDGRGARLTPWSTDPAELATTPWASTGGPFRFALSVRVALREDAPDVLVLPGPGNSLGGIWGSWSWPRATAGSAPGRTSRRRRQAPHHSCFPCADRRRTDPRRTSRSPAARRTR